METAKSLDRFEERLREREAEEDVRQALVALAVIREYFLDYAQLRSTSEIAPGDVVDFAFREVIRTGEASAAGGTVVMDLLANWLETAAAAERSPTSRETVDVARRLAADVPRVLEAVERLAVVNHAPEAEGIEVASDAGALGSLTAGVSRVVDLEQTRYEDARQDYFVVESVGKGTVTFRTGRPGDNEADRYGPVSVPPEAARLLKPGDVIRGEIAPSGGTWQFLEVELVYPCGYDWRG